MNDCKNILRTTPWSSGQKMAVFSKDISTDLSYVYQYQSTHLHIAIGFKEKNAKRKKKPLKIYMY